MALARQRWRGHQPRIVPKRLVFVDETAAATNLAPRYGWAARSERLVGEVPHGHWHTNTFVAGLTLEGVIAPLMIDGAMNAATFEQWVESALAPQLSKRAIVVMDNLAAHKGQRVRELIEAAGAEVRYLPPYSPDLNPIELAFAKLKQALRAAGCRTWEALWKQIGEVLARIAPTECAGYFAHAGYRIK